MAEVRAFLEACGLAALYADRIVEDEGFDDLETLRSMSPQELAADLPFVKTGHRRKLLQRLSALSAATAAATTATTAATTTAKEAVAPAPESVEIDAAANADGDDDKPRHGNKSDDLLESPPPEMPSQAQAQETSATSTTSSTTSSTPATLDSSSSTPSSTDATASLLPRAGRTGKGTLSPAQNAADVMARVAIRGAKKSPETGASQTETRQQQRAVDVLGSYVPNNLLAELRARHGKLPEVGAARVIADCALLMADISGFTKLNETLAREGSGTRGGEKMSLYLNVYFAAILDVVQRFGGDCQKIAGDALICTFEANATAAGNACAAVACALQLQAECGRYVDGDVLLTLHCGVAVGSVKMAQLGGFQERYEWTPTGEPLKQLEATLGLASSGEAVVSAATWKLVSAAFDGVEIDPDEKSGGDGGEVLVRALRSPIEVEPLPVVELEESDRELISKYVPERVLQHVKEGTSVAWASEVRDASVVFVNLFGLRLNSSHPMIDEAQTAVLECQRQIAKHDGYLRQFLCDDKGTTLIVVFGVPPFAHEDDSTRAVQLALALAELLLPMGIRHSIGISSGPVFVGSVGSDTRREHSCVSDVVNCSARLSGQKRHGDLIVCGLTAHHAATKFLKFLPEGTVRLKGMEMPVPIYRPSLVSHALRRRDATFTDFGPSERAIGREDEIREAVKALSLQDACPASRVRALIVEGSRGIGKSLLGRELIRRSVDSLVDCVMSEGDPMMSSTPYFAFGGVVEHIIGLSAESMTEKRFEVMEFVHEFCSPELRPYAPLLDRVLHIGLVDNHTTKGLKPEDASEKLDQLLCELVFRRALDSALLLVFDDAQALDEASWRVLARLINDERADVRLAVVILAHPLHDFRVLTDTVTTVADPQTNSAAAHIPHVHVTGQEHMAEVVSAKKKAVTSRARHMHLGGLGKDHMPEFVSSRTGVPANCVPPELVDLLAEKSTGNPLIALELLNAMLASQLVEIVEIEDEVDGRKKRVGLAIKEAAKVLALPRGAKLLVRDRLDSLRFTDDLFVKIAAAFGRNAPLHAVEGVFRAILKPNTDHKADETGDTPASSPRPGKTNEGGKTAAKKDSKKISKKSKKDKTSKDKIHSKKSPKNGPKRLGKRTKKEKRRSRRTDSESGSTTSHRHQSEDALPTELMILDTVKRLAEVGILGSYDHDTVRFFHSTMLDTVLESMVLDQRMAIHRAICQYYEELHSASAIPLATLGSHYAEVVLCQAETRVPDQEPVVKALSFFSDAVASAKWAGSALTVISLLEKKKSVVDACSASGDVSPAAREQLFDVLSEFGLALTALYGPGTHKAVPLFDRAVEVSKDLDTLTWDSKLPAFIGMWYTECVELRWEFSCSIANRLIEMGKRSDNVAIHILGLEFIMCCKVNQGAWETGAGYGTELLRLINMHRDKCMEAFGLLMFWPTGTLDYCELMAFPFSGRIADTHLRQDLLLDLDKRYDLTGEWEGAPKPYVFAHGFAQSFIASFVLDEPARFAKLYEAAIAYPDEAVLNVINDWESALPFGFFATTSFCAVRYHQYTGAVPLREGLSREDTLTDLCKGVAHAEADATMDGEVCGQLLIAAYISDANYDAASEVLERNKAYMPNETLNLMFRGVVAEHVGDESTRIARAMRFYDRSIRAGDSRHDQAVVRALHAQGKLAKAHGMVSELSTSLTRLKAFRDGEVAGFDYDDEYRGGVLAKYIQDLE